MTSYNKYMELNSAQKTAVRVACSRLGVSELHVPDVSIDQILEQQEKRDGIETYDQSMHRKNTERLRNRRIQSNIEHLGYSLRPENRTDFENHEVAQKLGVDMLLVEQFKG